MRGHPLRLTQEPAALERADVAIPNPELSRRELWKAIASDEELHDGLARALSTVHSRAQDQDLTLETKLREVGVTALDGSYRSELVAAAKYDSGAELIRLTRQLGGPISLGGMRSTLEDVHDAPLALLDAGDVDLSIALDLRGTGLLDVRPSERVTLLEWLVDLSGVLEVDLVLTGRQIRRLLVEHTETLPASVTASAKTDLQQLPTDQDKVTERAREAAEEIGLDSSAWDVLRVVLDEPAEHVGYHALASDSRLSLSRESVRKVAERLACVGEDCGLVDRVSHNGAHGASATMISRVALDYRDEHGPTHGASAPEDSPRSGGPTASPDVEADSQPDPSTPERDDPPKQLRRGRVNPHAWEPPRQQEPCPEDGEPSEDGPEMSRDGTAGTRWDSLDRHHAAWGAIDAADADIVLADRPADWSEELARIDRTVSFDDSRDELMIRWRGETLAAANAVRYAAALTSEKVLNRVLTPDRIDGADGDELAGLQESNPIVLRDARCIGWLEDGAGALKFREDLAGARQDLLELAGDLRNDDGSLDESIAAEVARFGHGLAGTIVQLLDLLDIDLVRVVELPNWERDLHGRRDSLLDFVSTAASISSRYGHYSGYRVLHETRKDKREDLLGTPAVDPDDPTGTHIGSWMLAGPGVSRLADDLEAQLQEPQPLQEDGIHYARFAVDVEVAQSWRRQAVARTVTRLGEFKGLDRTRATVSLLTGLLGSVLDVARAVHALGSETPERRLTLRDLKFGLSELPSGRLLPELEESTPGKVLSALLAMDGSRLSQRELAERAGVSTQSLRDNRELLEALGLVDVKEGDPGDPIQISIAIPDDVDDSSEQSDRLSWLLPADRDLAATPMHLALGNLLIELGHPAATAPQLSQQRDRPPKPFALCESWPELRGLIDIVAGLAGHDVGGMFGDALSLEAWRAGPSTRSSSWGQRPPRTQATLSAFQSAIGAD